MSAKQRRGHAPELPSKGDIVRCDGAERRVLDIVFDADEPNCVCVRLTPGP